MKYTKKRADAAKAAQEAKAEIKAIAKFFADQEAARAKAAATQAAITAAVLAEEKTKAAEFTKPLCIKVVAKAEPQPTMLQKAAAAKKQYAASKKAFYEAEDGSYVGYFRIRK